MGLQCNTPNRILVLLLGNYWYSCTVCAAVEMIRTFFTAQNIFGRTTNKCIKKTTTTYNIMLLASEYVTKREIF